VKFSLANIVSHERIFEHAETKINLGQSELQDPIEAHLEAKPNISVVILDNLFCLLPSIRKLDRLAMGLSGCVQRAGGNRVARRKR
tara:strand:- start:1113 stop:1370 length:258 start_codon:yes stop_codon:yes gene_type:complete